MKTNVKLTEQEIKKRTNNTSILLTKIKQEIKVLELILINIKIATAKLNHLDSGKALEATADIIHNSIQKINSAVEKINDNIP
nr:MAG: hypothetical protein B6I27_01935 [Erwiniaceae bacterium 4572_131]